jgi:hypothetical protein
VIHIRAFDRRDRDDVVALWHACDLVRPWTIRTEISSELRVRRDLFLVAIDDQVLVESVMAGYQRMFPPDEGVHRDARRSPRTTPRWEDVHRLP